MDVDHGEQILSSSDAWNLGLALLAAAEQHQNEETK